MKKAIPCNTYSSDDNIFIGLDDSIHVNTNPVDRERVVLYPNGQQNAKSFLIDYRSLNNERCKFESEKLSFSKALSQGTIINKKIFKNTKCKKERTHHVQNVHFAKKYLRDIDAAEYQMVSSSSVPQSGNVIIYEKPFVTFADIAPFVESYTDALLNSYKIISENEGKLQVEMLNEIVKQSEIKLGKVIQRQEKYLAAVRVRVDKMIDKFADKRQLVYELRDLKREYGNYKVKNDLLERQLKEAQEKLMESSSAGAASRKMRILSRKKKIDKNVSRLKNENKSLQSRLPNLEKELKKLIQQKEIILELLKSRDREIENTAMEIEVEQKMAKLKVAVPEEIRVVMQEKVLTLNSYSMFFKELATGLGFSLECKICGQRLFEPRQVWPCGHVFCQKCLQKSNRSETRLNSFADLIKAAGKRKGDLHKVLNAYNNGGEVTRIEFEIALRRVRIMLDEDKKKVLWDLIDPRGLNTASMGTITAVLSGKFGGLKAAESKFGGASKSKTAANRVISLCPFCCIEEETKQFVKNDPITDKILQRLGFFERDQTKDGDIIALCKNYKSSLDDIEIILR
jgi:hypothetical protein